MTKPAHWPYKSPEEKAKADATMSAFIKQITAPLPDDVANAPWRLAALERLKYRRYPDADQQDRDNYRDEMGMTEADMNNWEQPWQANSTGRR